ncbi:hypothetical protein GQ57_30515 [Burkholderia sp. MSh2]|uniref:Uncharacterized protein n=1 Tax=Burkholderia paludis TaxID=1506587 RepID=A0A6P2PGY0_9BURK|nr:MULTISPECIES: hypothetical protein [Burkholderia]KEZ02297.1 hypothetical protein GQ57_30515 [Burkholderia sp. MSh2]KFG98063.1 hypothetical protein GQ56_0107245 [Burkholderia paludis]CAB3760025.1 hypothetical protein LMG30113_03586 [Burkholderia paludis]VWC06298.1 hypothetical protein BPA30113_04998 [Burkholderia paludis]
MDNARQFPDFDVEKFVDLLRTGYPSNDEADFELPDACLKQCTGAQGEVLPDRFDAIAIELARGYHRGQLPYAFCDEVVNLLVGRLYADALVDRDTWPALFWEVYLAFDAGEYFRPGERDIDPVEKYTRPLIEEIVGKVSPGCASVVGKPAGS